MMTFHTDARIDAADLEALADEATRQRLSLACLIGAMEDGEPIAWMEGETHDVADR